MVTHTGLSKGQGPPGRSVQRNDDTKNSGKG